MAISCLHWLTPRHTIPTHKALIRCDLNGRQTHSWCEMVASSPTHQHTGTQWALPTKLKLHELKKFTQLTQCKSEDVAKEVSCLLNWMLLLISWKAQAWTRALLSFAVRGDWAVGFPTQDHNSFFTFVLAETILSVVLKMHFSDALCEKNH